MNSPYNTRLYPGLTPGPISNPGKAAPLACINPPQTQYLYYFTDRAGVTHFETNGADFERDKDKYGLSGRLRSIYSATESPTREHPQSTIRHIRQSALSGPTRSYTCPLGRLALR